MYMHMYTRVGEVNLQWAVRFFLVRAQTIALHNNHHLLMQLLHGSESLAQLALVRAVREV